MLLFVLVKTIWLPRLKFLQSFKMYFKFKCHVMSTKSIYFKLIVAKNIILFSAEWIKDISLSVIYQFSYFFGFSNKNIFVGPVESKQLRRGDMRRPENKKSKITNQFWIFEEEIQVKLYAINCHHHKMVSLVCNIWSKNYI